MTIQNTYKIYRNSVEITGSTNYSVDWDKNYGSAVFSFVLANNDGTFSSRGATPIKYGDTLEFYLNDARKFYGLVREIQPQNVGGIQSIKVSCYDIVSKLLDVDIEKKYESKDKYLLHSIVLQPAGYVDETDKMCRVFNFVDENGIKVSDIAISPTPVINIYNTTSEQTDPAFSGFEINYQTGQLVFGAAINTHNYTVMVDFAYYTTGLWVEDIIRDIIGEEDGYGNNPFSYQTNLVENYAETDSLPDTLSPNYVSDIDPSFSCLLSTALNDGTVVVGDPKIFSVTANYIDSRFSSGYIKLESEVIKVTSVDHSNSLFTCSERGALGTAAEEHEAGTKIYQAYPPGQIWYLKYNNLVNSATGEYTRYISEYSDNQSCLLYQPDGKMFVFYSRDGELRMRKMTFDGVEELHQSIVSTGFCKHPTAVWQGEDIVIIYENSGSIKRIVIDTAGATKEYPEYLLRNPYKDLAGYIEPYAIELDGVIKIAVRNGVTNKIHLMDYVVESLIDSVTVDSGTSTIGYHSLYNGGQATNFYTTLASCSGHWTFQVPKTGYYDISAGMGIPLPSVHFHQAVKYTITHAGGSTDVTRNQRTYAQYNPYSHPYIPIGQYLFNQYTNYTVTISGTIEPEYVQADDIRITYSNPTEICGGEAPSIAMDDDYIYYAFHELSEDDWDWVKVARTTHSGGSLLGPYLKFPLGKNVNMFLTVNNHLAYIYERESALWYAESETDWTTMTQDPAQFLVPENIITPGDVTYSFKNPFIIFNHEGQVAISFENNDSISDLYYYRVDNIIFPLNEDDFSEEYNSINYRFGMIILPDAIDITSTVTCATDYYYCTIQATGIETPMLEFNDTSVANRFEALTNVMKLLAPNYFIRADANNKIRGSYINQKVIADKSLSNVSVTNYINDKEIYTRVKVFGQNANPTNLCLDGDFVDETEVDGVATNLILSPLQVLFDSVDWDTGVKEVDLIVRFGGPNPSTEIENENHIFKTSWFRDNQISLSGEGEHALTLDWWEKLGISSGGVAGDTDLVFRLGWVKADIPSRPLAYDYLVNTDYATWWSPYNIKYDFTAATDDDPAEVDWLAKGYFWNFIYSGLDEYAIPAVKLKIKGSARNAAYDDQFSSLTDGEKEHLLYNSYIGVSNMFGAPGAPADYYEETEGAATNQVNITSTDARGEPFEVDLTISSEFYSTSKGCFPRFFTIGPIEWKLDIFEVTQYRWEGEYPPGEDDFQESWKPYIPGVLGITELKMDEDNHPIRVFVNWVELNGEDQRMVQQQVQIYNKTTTVTTTTDNGTVTKTHDAYEIRFPHTMILDNYYTVDTPETGETSEQPPIVLYNENGATVFIITNEPSIRGEMDWAKGIFKCVAWADSSDIESIATATYRVKYGFVGLDFDNETLDCVISPGGDDSPPIFYINSRILPESTKNVVAASFPYHTKIETDPEKFVRLIDGFYGTACQTEWQSKPINGLPYFTLELGDTPQSLDAIDIVSGFYYPSGAAGGGRKFDFSNTYSVVYSNDGINFSYICDELTKFSLDSGQSLQVDSGIEEEFSARYLRLIMEDVGKVEYMSGRWVVSIVEFSVWKNLQLVGEAKLLAQDDGGYCTVSGNVATDTTKTWTVDLKKGKYFVDSLGNTFTIVSNTATTISLDGDPYTGKYAIFDRKKTDIELYDMNDLLDKAGDKLYKITEINKYLNSQEKITERAKLLLAENVKNHTKLEATLFDGDFEVGETVTLTDPWTKNIKSPDNLFIEAISASDRGTSLTLAQYL